jgi:hypothetical protein
MSEEDKRNVEITGEPVSWANFCEEEKEDNSK